MGVLQMLHALLERGVVPINNNQTQNAPLPLVYNQNLDHEGVK